MLGEQTQREAPTSIRQRVAQWLATGFGAGFSPVAPGTAGTLVAIPPAALIAWLGLGQPVLWFAAIAATTALAIWSAGVAAPLFGLKDPGQIVVDEVAGYFVAMAFLPPTWTALAVSFLLFRLFDIVKPPPCHWAEGLPGGVGIVADDLLAGVYANLTARILCAVGLFSL